MKIQIENNTQINFEINSNKERQILSTYELVSQEMLEKALSLDPNNTRLLGDVANSYVEKAKTLSKASQETKMEFFQRAERLFIKAEQLKPDKCTYAQWAVLSYYQGDFEKCLEKARRANELDQGNKECEFVKRYGEECRDKLD